MYQVSVKGSRDQSDSKWKCEKLQRDQLSVISFKQTRRQIVAKMSPPNFRTYCNYTFQQPIETFLFEITPLGLFTFQA